MKRFILTIAAALVIGGLAYAGVDGYITIEGKGLPVESDAATRSFVVWGNGSAGDADDTGDEVCAQFGSDCVDVFTVDPAGGAGDELTDSDCVTDITTLKALFFCS